MPEIRKIQTKSIFLISEYNDVPAKGISKIATNQSLNQKVPVFLHRGFLSTGNPCTHHLPAFGILLL